MDTVISLRRPREYSMAEGARFEVHLTKARGILGDDANPLSHLITEGNACIGGFGTLKMWNWRN